MRGCACRGTAGFAHVSCLAEQAKILFAEAEEDNLGSKAKGERFHRWDTCSLCKQQYHGVVSHALGWACWKTYVGRPEADRIVLAAINVLGKGLSDANHNEDALTVMEAELAMLRRVGVSEHSILVVQSNLASTYSALGRQENAARMLRDVYSGNLRLEGEENTNTIISAGNYANSLASLQRYAEAKTLLRKTVPMARRVLGDSHDVTLGIRINHARALYENSAATVGDLREAVNSLEDTDRTARRVLGGAHPTTVNIERALQMARAMLAARETPPTTSRT